MARYLKQSTAFTFRIGPLLDSTDGTTAETALSIAQADIQISKDGGAFAQTSATTPTTTHDADGWYQCPLTATDTNTLGPITVQIVMAGALPVWEHFMVLPANVYDSIVDGSDALQVDTIQISGTVQTANDVGADVDAILVDTGTTLQGELDGIQADTEDIQTRLPAALVGGRIDATVDATGMEAGATAAIADAVWDEAQADHVAAGSFGVTASEIADILVDTAEIGAAGVGLTEAGGTGDHLTALAWNAAWDAEVQSEVTDALNAYDPPTNAEMEARTLVTAAYFDPAADTVDVGAISGSTTAADTLEEQMDAYEEGTAQAGAAGTITLRAGASATNDYYNGQAVWITGGTGAGQFRIIDDYVGSTKVASISPNWATNPDATSVYVLAGAPASTASPPAVNVTQVAGTAQTAGDVGADVAAILVDTGTTLPATLTTIDNEIAVIDGNVDSILVDTGTTLPATLSDMSGATFSSATDSLEAIRNRGDAAWTTGAGGTPPQLLQNTTIATLASQTSFTLTAGSADNDAYNNAIVVVTDASTSTQKAVGTISDYVGSTRTVTLAADPGIFTMAVGDTVDVIASTAGLTQSDVRAAVGMASANLDTQLSTIDTNVDAVLVDTGTTLPASLATIDGNVDAILVDTGTTIPALIAALNDPTATEIRDAILDRVLAGNHDVAGSVGAVIQAILTDTGTTLDGKLDAIDTVVDAILVDTGTTLDTKINTIDTAAAAIQTVTDNLPDSGALTTLIAQRSVPTKNSAFTFNFKMVDSTDFATPEAGLTVTATRSLDGAAFGSATGTVTEIGNGIYQMAASAADMNGNNITFRFTASGAAATTVTVITDGGV